jgi:hypothetical protein
MHSASRFHDLLRIKVVPALPGHMKSVKRGTFALIVWPCSTEVLLCSPNSWLHFLLVSPSWSSYTPTSQQSWQWFVGGSFCRFIASLLHPVLYHSLLQSGTMMNWHLPFKLFVRSPSFVAPHSAPWIQRRSDVIQFQCYFCEMGFLFPILTLCEDSA